MMPLGVRPRKYSTVSSPWKNLIKKKEFTHLFNKIMFRERRKSFFSVCQKNRIKQTGGKKEQNKITECLFIFIFSKCHFYDIRMCRGERKREKKKCAGNDDDGGKTNVHQV
jgi:hypothetical protein